MGRAIAIVGCGNPNRRDDGAGQEVLRLLRPDEAFALRDGAARLLDAGTDGMAVMFAAKGCGTLLIVDACRSGSEPGAVFEVPGSELAQPPRSGFTLHDFRWDHALFAGRQMFAASFPSDVRVFLIEAETVDLGIGLSEAVAGAARKVADRIRAIVAAMPSAPEGQPVTGAQAQVQLRQRRLYIARPVYETHFGGGASVILLRQDRDLLVLPVRHAASGGYVLKIRNAAGDRVVDAGDYFRDQGLADSAEWEAGYGWCETSGGLRLYEVFLM